MTHHRIRTLEDGTRVYSNYVRYTPVAPEERINGVNRPDDPRAVRFHTRWFLPLDVLDDEDRVLPETRPDTDAYDHMTSNIFCRCDVCRRPHAEHWRRKWRYDHGLRRGAVKKNPPS